MGQGYEHPGPGHPHTRSIYETIEPHSGIVQTIGTTSSLPTVCPDFTFIDKIDRQSPETFPIADAQLFLNGF